MVLFGIMIGLFLGIIISFSIIQCLASFASKYGVDNSYLILLDYRVKLQMSVPISMIVLTIILSYIIILISSLLPMRRLSKISPIEEIKENKDSDLKAKMLKTPKIIGKIFKEEGELAYKNVRKDKSRYKTIVLSLIVSIILFLVIRQAYSISKFSYGEGVSNNAKRTNATIYISGENYTYEELQEAMKVITEYLQNKGLIEEWICAETLLVNNEKDYNRVKLMISFPKNKLTKKGITLYENDLLTLYEDNENKENYLAEVMVYVTAGSIYDNLTNEIGVNELNKNECIIRYTQLDTKFGKKVDVVKYDIGDMIEIREIDSNLLRSENKTENKETSEELSEFEKEIMSNILGDFVAETVDLTTTNNNVTTEELNLQNYELKTVGIFENYVPNISSFWKSPFTIIINQETLDEWAKGDNISKPYSYGINFYTEDGETVKNEMDNINAMIEKYGLNASWSNIYELENSNAMTNKVEDTVLYAFLGMIALLCSVNIFTTISAGITLRTKEFAMLKSIGMSNKQITKMLILESIFYALDSLIYGILISIVLLFIMYMYAIDRKYYAFYIPWKDILFCITITYLITFIAMFVSRKNKNKNIIETIKNENI